MLYHNDCVPIVISQAMQNNWGHFAVSTRLWVDNRPVGRCCLELQIASNRQNITCARSRELKAATFNTPMCTTVQNLETNKQKNQLGILEIS